MKESQKKQIKEYLEAGGFITPMAALEFWGCFRLGARIWEIKQDYYDEYVKKVNENMLPFIEPAKEIKTEMITTSTGKRVAQYSLIKLVNNFN